MSEVSHSDELVTKQDLSNFYQGILPYLGGMPEMLANKFSKGDLYSTDEKMIGQWIDGRPLYQKTVVVTSPASAGVDTIVASFDASMQPREMIGLLDNTIPLNYNGANEWYTKTRLEPSFSNSVVTGINIRMIVAGYTNRVTRITVRYTKNTDSAISIGSDTDYSTTEKIVGTWIDGKPIYQKTFNNIPFPANITDGTAKYRATAHGIANIENIISVKRCSNSNFPEVWGIDGTNKIYFASVAADSNNITTYSNRSILSDVSVKVTLQYTKV